MKTTEMRCAYCNDIKPYPSAYFDSTAAECWECVIKREYKDKIKIYRKMIEFLIYRFGLFEEPIRAIELLLKEYEKDDFKKKKYFT